MNAILAIAARDITKFLRDPARIVASLVFPVVFIGVLGQSFGRNANWTFDYVPFIFTGVYAQTLFQSAALGVVSLLEDRENDFTQEIFISPVSRYSILFGKILGEALVSLTQGIAIIIFGFIIGVAMSPTTVISLLIVGAIISLFGGGFGILVMANLSSQRVANQIFPFIFFPQFVLAGVFNPIKHFPWYLSVLSYISPMRYAVDLTRNVYYLGSAFYSSVVLENPVVNLAIMGGIFLICLLTGTFIFVRNERNR